MYGLRASEDLSFLLNVELIQICIGVNEAILNGDHDVRITILSDFSVTRPGHATIRFSDTRTGAQALIGLLNEVIQTAKATESGDLLLGFSSGTHLQIFDMNRNYESFWIRAGNREIIV